MIEQSGRWPARVSLACFYLAAGILHLARPALLMQIMPAWVPFPFQIIVATGVCEVVGGLAILTRSLRRAAGIAFALYAICVYPANIKHAIDSLSGDSLSGGGHPLLGWWYHIPRLILQPVIVWWALYAGGILSWPFKTKR